MSAGRGVGMSRYAGLRITLTFHPQKDDVALLTVAAKQVSSRWDEWTALIPTQRLDGECIVNLQGALDAVFRRLDECEDIAWSSQP